MKKQKARNIILGGAIGCVAVVVVVVALAMLLRPPAGPAEQSAARDFSGKIACAPKKAGIATLECAYGIQTDDGKDYLLYAAMLPSGTNIQQYPTGTSVVVTGTVSSPDSDSQVYDVDGTIMATAIRAK